MIPDLPDALFTVDAARVQDDPRSTPDSSLEDAQRTIDGFIYSIAATADGQTYASVAEEIQRDAANGDFAIVYMNKYYDRLNRHTVTRVPRGLAERFYRLRWARPATDAERDGFLAWAKARDEANEQAELLPCETP